MEGPDEGVVGVHVVQEVDTVDGGELLHLVRLGGQQEAGLETVQLVLRVEMMGEGLAGPEEECSTLSLVIGLSPTRLGSEDIRIVGFYAYKGPIKGALMP